MARTEVGAGELNRVLLARIEEAITAGEQIAAQQPQLAEAMTEQDGTPSRNLLAFAEWHLAALHTWRLELLNELAQLDLP
jgi:hypothetical protein